MSRPAVTHWQIRRGTTVSGPYLGRDLKRMAALEMVTPTTEVSPDGHQWLAASEVDGLFDTQGKAVSVPPAIRLRGVRKTYTAAEGSRVPVIAVENFELPTGARAVLSGPSGAGKTTLLHLLAGLLDTDAGTIEIDGVELGSLSAAGRDRFRGERIGLVFQTFNLAQGLTALENITLAMMFGRLPASVHRARAEDLLCRVGLAGMAHRRPGELSVGQQQRVAIARALANNPALVLADEPAANLDETNARAVAALLDDVCRQTAATLLVVAHDAIMQSAFPTRLDMAAFSPPCPTTTPAPPAAPLATASPDPAP